MTDQSQGYATNRAKSRNVVRVITELPMQLVQDLDSWGVSAGMTSRREATETLIKKGLEAVRHGSA